MTCFVQSKENKEPNKRSTENQAQARDPTALFRVLSRNSEEMPRDTTIFYANH